MTTESLAMKRRCPFARALGYDAPINCLGSGCMAWEFSDDGVEQKTVTKKPNSDIECMREVKKELSDWIPNTPKGPGWRLQGKHYNGGRNNDFMYDYYSIKNQNMLIAVFERTVEDRNGSCGRMPVCNED